MSNSITVDKSKLIDFVKFLKEFNYASGTVYWLDPDSYHYKEKMGEYISTIEGLIDE